MEGVDLRHRQEQLIDIKRFQREASRSTIQEGELQDLVDEELHALRLQADDPQRTLCPRRKAMLLRKRLLEGVAREKNRADRSLQLVRHIIDKVRALCREAHMLEQDSEGREAQDKNNQRRDEAGESQSQHLRLCRGGIESHLHIRPVMLRAVRGCKEILHHRAALLPLLARRHAGRDVIIELTPSIVVQRHLVRPTKILIIQTLSDKALQQTHVHQLRDAILVVAII